MKTMLLAAATLSLGIGAACASDSEGQTGNPVYVFPGSVSATVTQNAPPAATAQSGPAIHALVTRSSSEGTWLSAPAQDGNG